MMVWIEMLPEDRNADLDILTQEMDDPRIRWFHDPSHRAGEVIAEILNAAELIAWDVYLFFDREAHWLDKPPRPLGWVHQLGGGQADPDRYHPGGQLYPELVNLFSEMVGSGPGRPA